MYANIVKNFDKNRQKEYTLYNCVDMRLTREDVLKNADYFNSILKKHNLDYTIK